MTLEPCDAPLRSALAAIRKIAAGDYPNTQDAREALWAIKDEVEGASEAYLANIVAAQKAEIASLKSAVA